MIQRRIGTIAIGLIAVLTVGLMSFGTGLASIGDVGGGLDVFADQGGNDKDKNKNDDPGNNNGNGNSGDSQDDDSDNDDSGVGDDEDNGTPTDDGDNGTPVDDGKDKVGICHTTGSDSNSIVYIEVSENAVPAHEAHDDEIGVDSEDECGEGTPIPGDGTATPEATPEEDD